MNSLFFDWINSLKQYFLMSLFMSSPARLPYSPAAVLLSLLAYILIGEILLGDERSLASIIVQISLEVLILTGISFIALKIKKNQYRLLQTVSALIGVNLILSLVSLLIVPALPDSNQLEQTNSQIPLIHLLLLLWNLAVISLIFKRAFDIRTITAGFIALNFFVIYEFLLLNFI